MKYDNLRLMPNGEYTEKTKSISFSLHFNDVDCFVQGWEKSLFHYTSPLVNCS